MPPHAEMLVKIVTRRPGPGPARAAGRIAGQRTVTPPPRYFISRANDFSRQRPGVARPARAAHRAPTVTHDIVSNEPPGPCSPPRSPPPGRPAEGHRERWRGSVRPAEPPPTGAREQGQRSAGSSLFNPMAGLPSRNWNILAPDSRAHSHRSTRRRHSDLAKPPAGVVPGQCQDSLYLINGKRLRLINRRSGAPGAFRL
jgi:hypothetical protein